MDTTDILIQIKANISELKKAISSPLTHGLISDKWIPRSLVMDFLNYGDTQMASLEKSGVLTVTKIGKRKFIHRDSVSKLLDKNIIRIP